MAIIERRRELLGEEVLPIGSFSSMTMAEIKQVCDAGKAQSYVNKGTWTIGDTNSGATYGSYSGVRLVHVLTEEQRGSDYYGTSGHIIVEFVKIIKTSEWSSSVYTQTSYSASTILSTLNTIYSSGINSAFKAVLSSFAPATSVQSSSKSSVTTSIEHPSGYLHTHNCVEIGSTNTYRPSENDKSFCFSYYSDSSTAESRRAKSGASTAWWLRSPAICYGNGVNMYKAYLIDNVGSVYYRDDNIAIGVVPIGCI